jgi:CheY-like chemotaxis protein
MQEICFPLQSAHTRWEHPHVMATDAPRLHGMRILVVDDNEDSRAILEATFTHLGAAVLTAKAGAEALDVLRADSPHVIISDLSMPGMDGLELMRRVRTLPGEAERPTPAIALSGFVALEDRERARRTGYQLFVPKPVDPLHLAQEVLRLVRRATER